MEKINSSASIHTTLVKIFLYRIQGRSTPVRMIRSAAGRRKNLSVIASAKARLEDESPAAVKKAGPLITKQMKRK